MVPQEDFAVLTYNGTCAVCPIHEMKKNGSRYLKGNPEKGKGGQIAWCDKVNGRCYIRATSTPKGKKKRLAEGKEPYESRVGLSTKFEEYGINVDNVGRHHLHLFMYYTDLNFNLPSVPNFDCLGKFNSNTVSKQMIHDVREKFADLQWAVHHINVNKYDDRKENLCLCLNTEHAILHWLYKAGKYEEAKELMNTISHRNYHLFGEHCCPREFEI